MSIPSFTLHDGPVLKGLRSAEANWLFDKRNGHTVMWGKTPKEDMKMSPIPILLDLECTTKCAGPSGKPCSFCYKSNGPEGKNMSFETFKTIIDKMKFVTQVAFGADAQGTSNPDLFRMMAYAREIGIVPNLTVAEIDDHVANGIAFYAGACAISRYDNKDLCYDSVKKLTDRGMKQVNIHFCLHKGSLNQLVETFTDILIDDRLKKLNAIVLLSLKKKGRGKKFESLTQEQFTEVVKLALNMGIPLGFDSCSARKFERAIEILNPDNKAELLQLTVPCESARESAYVDVHGKYFPCSFTEGEHPDWKDGLSVIDCEDFVKDIWYHPLNVKFRNIGLDNISKNIACQIYEI